MSLIGNRPAGLGVAAAAASASKPTETPEADVGTESVILATFSSKNMTGYAVGDFKFENGILTFKSDQAEELETFRKIIDSKNFPPQERSRIVEIDVAAAEKYLAEARRGMGGATQAIDSTVGERVSKPKSEGDLGTTSGAGN